MEENEKIYDSPTGWVAEHVRRYVESEGRSGHIWRGAPTLLLTTRGRKTGKLRRTALIYGVDGNRYVVVASRGGHPRHPNWYLNLVENPHVEVQVGAERFSAYARTATPEEGKGLWRLMTSIWPAYDEYQEKTSRELPVVVLERTTSKV